MTRSDVSSQATGRAVSDRAWRAIVSRDGRQDGEFVYGVRTTGIYCRPSCASRLPRREHVAEFERVADAEHAGFRACKRCDPADPCAVGPGVALVKRACAYIDANLDTALPLSTIARAAHGSSSHVQRTFKRVLGVSPRAYVDAQRQARLRRGLREGRSVSRAVYEAGYGSSRPVYESNAFRLGMTPATYRSGGAGAVIRYTVVDTPLGSLLVAATDRGVCSVRMGNDPGGLESQLRAEFPAATLERNPGARAEWVAAIQASVAGGPNVLDLPLDVRSTAFQRRVWEALRRIPAGETRTYAEVAAAIGSANGARAVARACATNPVALVVPCHRVVRTGGELAGYRWGVERKRALLAAEQRSSAVGRR